MEKTEKIGIGVATAGHVLLFGLLSTSFFTPNPLKLNSPPMDVSLVDQIDLKSTAPDAVREPPPPTPAEEKGQVVERAAPAPEPRPEPAQEVPAPPPPKPAPPRQSVEKAKPKPPAPAKPVEKPKPTPPKKAEDKKPAKPAAKADTGKAQKSRSFSLDMDSIAKSANSETTPRKPSKAGTPAAAVGPAQKAALDAEIRRQLKPYWKAPTGADADVLRTIVQVDLNRDGSISGTPQVVETLGQTPSNRGQVSLHQELAVKAIRLAAPFRLPPDLYDGWKSLKIGFDRRLSQ